MWVRHMLHAAARSSLAPPSNTLQRDRDVDRQSDSPLRRLTTERPLPGFAPAEMVAPGQQPQQGVCGFLGQGGSLPMQGQFMGSSGQYDASYQTQHAYSPPGMVSPQHTDMPPPRGRQISPNGQHWGGVPTGGAHACAACGYDASGYEQYGPSHPPRHIILSIPQVGASRRALAQRRRKGMEPASLLQGLLDHQDHRRHPSTCARSRRCTN